MINAAFGYIDEGYCVMPVGRDKKPLIQWKGLQTVKSTRGDVQDWWTKHPTANIGIVTGSISDICVVDVDTAEGAEALKKIIPGIQPNVQTPNGGWHFYFSASNGLGNATRFLDGVDFRGEGGYIVAPPSIGENGKPYKIIKDNDINREMLLPESIINLLKNTNTISNTNIINCKDHATNGVYNCLHLSTDVYKIPKGGRDAHLFHLANHLVKGRMPEENIRFYLHFFAAHCDPPFTQKETEIKIKSAFQRQENQERNITQEIRDYVLSTTGYFLSTEVHNCLQLSTRNERKLSSQVLARLTKEGVIEKFGSKNGMFRRIEVEAPDMDIFNTKVDYLDLKFPLGLHTLYRPMPKNLIVIAGTQDAGKTAFMLRFAQMNMNRPGIMPIRYMTSEMGSVELVDRLEDFDGVPLDHWKTINFKEVSANFQDYILPDGINIIDYLEISDSFYLIGAEMKKIYDKLRSGVAIIALQKDFKNELGRGGSFSLEKPRLYVSLTSNPPEGGIAKIVKCKNWVNKRVNPNGKVCHFKIRDGNEVRMVTEWDYQKKGSLKQAKNMGQE